MAFVPKDWKDLPNTTTPLSEAAIEDLETRLSDYTDAAESAAAYTDSAIDDLRDEPLPLSTLQTGGTYALVLADLNTMVRMSLGTGQTVTVPSAVFAAGDRLEISQELAGVTTIAAGAGMTLQSPAVGITMTAQYGQALLTFMSSTVCRVTGDVE